jgi:hypothetical protein
MPYEQSLPVWVCREPLRTLTELRAEARFAV